MARGGLISGLISGAVKAGSGIMAGRLQGEQALREREKDDAERQDRRLQQELNLSLLRGRVQDQQTEEAGESGAFDALHGSDPQRYPTRIPGIRYRNIYESGASSSQRTTPAPDVNRAAYERVPATAFPGGKKPAFSTAQNWVDVEKGWINGERQQQNRVEVYVQTPPRGRGGRSGASGGADSDDAAAAEQKAHEMFATNSTPASIAAYIALEWPGLGISVRNRIVNNATRGYRQPSASAPATGGGRAHDLFKHVTPPPRP